MNKLKHIVLLICLFILISISMVSSTVKISGDAIIGGTVSGTSPLKIGHEGISFFNDSGGNRFSIYQAQGFDYNVPEAFENSLIFQTESINNPYNMEVCFWDKELQAMSLCLNEGASGRATTVYRSMQIVGNDKLPNDSNFTLCEGYDYIDCNTSTTGADLGVADDIEAKGSIYSQESIRSNRMILNAITDKGDCNSSTHGDIVYGLDNQSLGTHYACRQKKDAAGYEWKPLY